MEKKQKKSGCAGLPAQPPFSDSMRNADSWSVRSTVHSGSRDEVPGGDARGKAPCPAPFPTLGGQSASGVSSLGTMMFSRKETRKARTMGEVPMMSRISLGANWRELGTM